jgi:Tfp pilus assembly protein PilF
LEESPNNRISPETQQQIIETKQRAESAQTNRDAWIALGNAYYDADMHHQAIEAYDHALALKPDDADVLNDQGAMYRQSGNIAQALKNLEQALKIAPYNLETLYNLGYVNAFDLKRIDLALELWRRYLELDRTSETARQVQSFIDRYGH